jgi:ACS family tartrate transporter-like MFS transporter
MKLLPNAPADAQWLTQPERDWITRRVKEAHIPVHSGHNILHALRDPRVWQLGLFNLFMLACSYTYSFIAPDLIQRATHLNTTSVGFIISGLSLLGAAGMFVIATFSDRALKRNPAGKSRYNFILPCCLLLSLGFLLCGIFSTAYIVVPALGMLIVGFNSMQGPLWSLPATFMQGRSAAAGIAAINMIGMLGGFLGPYWIGFAKDLTGDYQHGLLLMTPVMLMAAAIMLYLRQINPAFSLTKSSLSLVPFPHESHGHSSED